MELQELLTECAKHKASDLHLKAGTRPILRIHGHLEIQDDLAPVSHRLRAAHTCETARDAATNPDDFDLKVKGILSTGEMKWDMASGVGMPPAAGMPHSSHAEAESSHFRKR